VSLTPDQQIAADMRALPEATRKAVRPQLRAAGAMIVNDAKSRANWSTRIPGTIRMTTSFRNEREGVTIIAGNASAPHSRPYEDISGRGKFRHPVFADATNKTRGGWRWVTQASRPFLLPAAQANEGAATAAVRSALDEAAASIGF
jgi:hypothetical protein